MLYGASLGGPGRDLRGPQIYPGDMTRGRVGGSRSFFVILDRAHLALDSVCVCAYACERGREDASVLTDTLSRAWIYMGLF